MTSRQRTWVVGAGHLPLPEARRWALEQVELQEAKVADLRTAFEEARRRRREAIVRATAAEDALRVAEIELVRRRADLAWRCGGGEDV